MSVEAQPVESTSASGGLAPGRRCSVGALLRHWAAVRPEAICSALDDDVFTFREMDARSDVLAAGLAALGVTKGDRVATLAPNRVEILELFYALARTGAVQVPLNAYLKGTFLHYQLAHSRASVLIVDEAGRQAVEPLLGELPDLETIVLLDEEPAGLDLRSRTVVSYSVLSEAGEQPPDVEVTAADTMSIVYTSGTTGLPKGCICSHGYYCRCGEVIGAALELRDDDVLFAGLPLFHAGGRLMLVMCGLFRGLPARAASSFSASGFFTRISETGATVAIILRPMGLALLAAPPRTQDRDHSLRTVMCGPMSPAAQQQFRERFGVEPWTEVLGQTECTPYIVTPVSASNRDPEGCGLPAPDLEIGLLDDGGCAVPDGELGEICVRPSNRFSMFDGYWEQPEDTLHAFRNLWYHTGDVAYRQRSGSLVFVDRKKDMVRRRGENVSSIEVEGVLNAHPDIIESAVHAVPSALEDDDVKACIVVREGLEVDPLQLFEFFKQNLPYYAVPRYLEVVDSLPRNAVGRVMKHVLRERGITENVRDFEALGLIIARNDRR